MSARSEAIAEMEPDRATFDIEAIFRAEYDRIARLIARVVRDPARAEEIAVEVFLKLWRNPRTQDENAQGWLYRSAVRAGLDELRRSTRRTRYERLLDFVRRAPTPEEIRAATEERDRVRLVLSILEARQAELLVLRSHGHSYGEVALALNLNPASVGTLISRAQQAFRKEYIKRYGGEGHE